MNTLRLVLVCGLMASMALVSQARQDKKIDKAKLVGTWTFVKTTSKEALPPGASMKVSFTKDGKMTLAIGIKDKEFKVNGTYSIKGNKLTTTLKSPDGSKEKTETSTIKELTDKKLVMEEKGKGGDNESTEFKKD